MTENKLQKMEMWVVDEYRTAGGERKLMTIIPTKEEETSGRIAAKPCIIHKPADALQKAIKRRMIKSNVKLCFETDGLCSTATETSLPSEKTKHIKDFIWSEKSSAILNSYERIMYMGQLPGKERGDVYAFLVPNSDGVYDYSRANILFLGNIASLDHQFLNDHKPVELTITSGKFNYQPMQEKAMDPFFFNEFLNEYYEKSITDIGKYDTLWVLHFNEETRRGYCIIPTAEEINKGKLISDLTQQRIFHIRDFRDENCIYMKNLLDEETLKDGLLSFDKIYVPEARLMKMNKEITILNRDNNEIAWAMSDEYPATTFYTKDPVRMNFILDIQNKDRARSLFEAIKSMNCRMKVNPKNYSDIIDDTLHKMLVGNIVVFDKGN